LYLRSCFWLIFLGQIDVVDELHRQRRGALQLLTVDSILDRGADDALVVERAVLKEPPVLDRHRRLFDDLRDLAAGQRRVHARRPDVPERRPVGGEHLRRRAGDVWMAGVEVRRRMGDVDDPAGDGQGTHRDAADDEHGEEAEGALQRGTAIAPAAALSITSAHGGWRASWRAALRACSSGVASVAGRGFRLADCASCYRNAPCNTIGRRS
jgi:hypothetical protein